MLWNILTLNVFIFFLHWKSTYRSGTVNLNTVNSNFHLIRSFCEIFFYHFPNISCLKCTVNSNFHLIRRKTLPTNDFELTVPDLYIQDNFHEIRVLAQIVVCINGLMPRHYEMHLLFCLNETPIFESSFCPKVFEWDIVSLTPVVLHDL